MITSERIDRWCERGILGLFLFILVFSPLAIGAVRSFEFIYVQAATVCITALWLVRCWARQSFEIFWPPISWPVLAFVLYALYGYLHADLEYVGRLEFSRVCVYALLFFAAMNNLHRQEYIQIISWALLGLAALIAVYALYQFGTHSPYVWHFQKPLGYYHRGSGTYINPNHLAGFMELILPVGLAMVLLGRLSHVARIVLTYVCVLMVIAIGVSLSRGGWIATALMLVCFFITLIIQTRSRWIIIGVVLLLFGLTSFYIGNSVQFQNRFQKTFVGGKVEDSRFDYWKPTIKMWKDHLWTGVGPGHFDERFPSYRPREVQARPKYAHNDYLNALAEWGLAGGAIIIAFGVLFYIGVFKASKYLARKSESGDRRSNRSAFVFGSAFGVLSLLLHSVTDFNMQIPANAIILFVFAALASTQLRYSERMWIGNRIVAKLGLSLFLLAGIGFLGFYGARKVQENYWLKQAQASKLLADEIASYKRAVEIEPMNFTTMDTLGEILRTSSFEGNAGYEKQAEEALGLFKRAMALNPFSPYDPLGCGMCLDWLGRTKEAEPYFAKALEIDPNSYYIVGYQGWHLVNKGEYAAAQKWFEQSLSIYYSPFAQDYLEIVRQKLAAAASE